MTREARVLTNAEGAYRDLTDLVPPHTWMSCKVGRHGVPLMLRRREQFAGLRDVESYYERMRPHLIREGHWPVDKPMPHLDWSGDTLRSWHTPANGGTISFSQSGMEEVSVLHELAHHLHERGRGERVHGETYLSLYVDIVSVCVSPDAGLALSIFNREHAERKSV